MRRSPDQTRPEFRQLRIYAIDPMVSRTGEHQATVQIRFEDLAQRGADPANNIDAVSFAGRRVEVVDVDAAGATPVWLMPVDLNGAHIAMQHGLDPSESDHTPGLENLLHDLKRADGRPAKRRFLPVDKDRYPSQFGTPTLPGVTIHVLGPPTDAAFRKQLKILSSWAFDNALPHAPGDGLDSPFSPEWYVPAARLPSRRPFLETTLASIRLFNDDLLYAARALESFLNGESLVLVLEFGKARLLLPGDAEVGAWTMILANPDALALAASATFLKVGHHGSHNATPIAFLREHLARKTPAVISTQEGKGKYRNGIPFTDLIEVLNKRSMPFCRSDKPRPASADVFTPEPSGRWVDCSIPC
jgi:hypothetical protein